MRRTAATPVRPSRHRLLTGLAAALACAGVLGVQSAAASTAPAGDPDASVVVGMVLEPGNLDILHTAGAALEQVLLDNIYETLLTSDDGGNVGPGLATLDVSDDGLSYTLTLQDGVTFSDGKPLTSADVKWSLDQARYPGAPAGDGSTPAASDATTPSAPGNAAGNLASIATVEAPDDSTVVLTLAQPDNLLAFQLSQRGGAVLEEGATDLENSATGTGPFTLEEWNQGSSITLARNDSYWGTPAGAAEVTFQYFTDPNAAVSALQDGDADLLTGVQAALMSQFEDNPDWVVSSTPSNGEYTLGYNNKGDALSDIRVRQAISRAIDKQGINELVNGYGTIIGGPLPPFDPAYEDLSDINAFDPESSKQLLADAGYGDGLDLTFVVPNIYPTNINDYIVSSLGDVGINVTVQSVEFPTWINQVYIDHDYDLTAVLHVEPKDYFNYANPAYYWQYDSPTVQDLLSQARTTTDPDQAIDLTRQAARQIAEDAPVDWLYLANSVVVASPDLSGYPTFDVNNRFDASGIVLSD